MDNHKPKTVGELIKTLTSDEFEMDDEIKVLDNGVLITRRSFIGPHGRGIKLTGGIQLPEFKN